MIRVLGKLEHGGAQLALLRLTRELDRRHGVHTTLLVGDATPEGLRLARSFGVDATAFRTGSPVHPVRNLQWQQSWPFATWLADKLGAADVVHAHMVGAWWAVASVIDAETPLIATEHNQVNWTPRQIQALRPAAGRIDRFYAMGPAARRFAVQAGVRPESITAARSPVDGLRGRPRAGLRTPRVTFTGRFGADKGIDVLVEAIALIDHPGVSYYLLGDGPLREAVTDRIRQLGLGAQVVTPGWVDNPWTYVAGSAAHVVPSREEAWSQSAVLALGLGVPVIGTTVDGLSDTLSRSRGLLVRPDDPAALSAAVSSVLAGRATTDRAGGVAYARQFTTPRVAAFYLAAYRELLDRRTPAITLGDTG